MEQEQTKQSVADALTILRSMYDTDPEVVAKMMAEAIEAEDASHKRLEVIERRLGIKRSKPKPAFRAPDTSWSFKGLPAEADLGRILEDAEKDGVRAVAIVLCGMELIALDTRRFLLQRCPLEISGRVMLGVREHWVVMSGRGDPVPVLERFLRQYDAWAAKPHRTTVAGWR